MPLRAGCAETKTNIFRVDEKTPVLQLQFIYAHR